ncbi:helix-turn-helix domain-containing protein [Paenibacillus sp. JCM 10914]|uniref:helix-turn-helix domain-containing protein n=1 Tax=Paenibacillus sp. JCM 10914 TaxID=1236974 RepID=UPI0003CC9D7B|nr:helix-turn-helix domain-containing protein [Paenibacillus sp. JCM 10914]GAE08713.1 transcriptional regulator, ArsR family [Paenibacillus sp. JCM 10914]
MNEAKLETNRYPASRIVEIAKALSSDVRVRILEALGDKPMSVGQLARHSVLHSLRSPLMSKCWSKLT